MLVYQAMNTNKLQNVYEDLASKESYLRDKVLTLEKKNSVVDLDEYNSKSDFESNKYHFKLLFTYKHCKIVNIQQLNLLK